MHYHVYYTGGIAMVLEITPEDSAIIVASIRRNPPHPDCFRVVVRPKQKG